MSKNGVQKATRNNLSSGRNCGLELYRQTDLHVIVPDILSSSLSRNLLQIIVWVFIENVISYP